MSDGFSASATLCHTERQHLRALRPCGPAAPPGPTAHRASDPTAHSARRPPSPPAHRPTGPARLHPRPSLEPGHGLWITRLRRTRIRAAGAKVPIWDQHMSSAVSICGTCSFF